jgi:hypothetical protein
VVEGQVVSLPKDFLNFFFLFIQVRRALEEDFCGQGCCTRQGKVSTEEL